MSYADTAFQFDPSVTVHCNSSLYAIHDPDRAEWCSADFPAHIWGDVSEAARVFVLTSTMELAKRYLKRAQRITGARRDYMTLHNDEGGSIHYASWGSALGGRRFDYVICSDPKGAVPEADALAFLSVSVLPKVLP